MAVETETASELLTLQGSAVLPTAQDPPDSRRGVYSHTQERSYCPIVLVTDTLFVATASQLSGVQKCRYSHIIPRRYTPMYRYLKGVASLTVGALGLVTVGIGVTELLAPYVWPSSMLGLPIGTVFGVALVAITYLGLTYWEERRATGTASRDTVRRFWTTTAGFLGFVTGGGLAVVVSTQVTGLLSAILLVGLPVGLVSGALAASLVFRRDWERRPPPASPV